MAQISIIIIAGLIFLFSYSPDKTVQDINPVLTISTTLVLTFVPAILAYILGTITTRKLPERQEVKVKKLYFLEKSFIVFEVLALGAFIVELYLLELPALIDRWLSFFGFVTLRRLIAMIPLITGILLIRLAAYELKRRIHKNKRERGEYLFTQLKFMMFPLIPLLVYLFFIDIAERLPIEIRIFFIDHQYMFIFILGIFVVFVYIAAPKLLQFLWKSKPLEDAELRNRIKILADSQNIKYKDISVWQTGTARIANAGVTGLLPSLRKIFVTDALLDNFSNEEIETIIAHEFGHIRHKHLLIYLAFSLTYFTGYTTFYAYIFPLWEKFFGSGSISQAIVTIIFFGIYFVLIFRYLSRKFERQSDLYAIMATGAPEAFKSALVKLSYFNYVPQKIKKWLEIFQTHPSISNRLEFVDRAVAGDKDALKYRNMLLETKITLLLLPVLLVLFFFNIDKLASPVELHFEKGRQYYRENMTNKAIEEFQKVVTIEPDFAEVHYILALIYSEEEKWNKAEKHLLEVLEIDEDNQDAKEMLAEVHIEKGKQYYQKDMIDKTIEEFNSAVEIKPNLSKVHYILALMYGKQEKWNRTQEHLLEILKADKNNKEAKEFLAELHVKKGQNYFKKEMIDKAIQEFNSAVKVDTNLAEVHYILALIYSKQEKWNRAKKHLSEILKNDTDNKEAKKLLEEVQEHLSDKKRRN